MACKNFVPEEHLSSFSEVSCYLCDYSCYIDDELCCSFVSEADIERIQNVTGEEICSFIYNVKNSRKV